MYYPCTIAGNRQLGQCVNAAKAEAQLQRLMNHESLSQPAPPAERRSFVNFDFRRAVGRGSGAGRVGFLRSVRYAGGYFCVPAQMASKMECACRIETGASEW